MFQIHRYGAITLLAIGSSLVNISCGQMPTDNAARLEVNDTLRQACPGASDDEIRAGLLIVDAVRQDGGTQTLWIGIMTDQCATAITDPTPTECMICNAAMSHQIWSE